MLSMKMLEDDIYNLIILAIMRFVFIFSLNNKIAETTKFGLVCYPSRKLLLLFNFKPYKFPDRKSNNIPVILEIMKENSLIISSPQWISDVCTADDFCVVLVEPPESWFIAGKSLSDINYICYHASTVIELDKKFDFSLCPHQLNSLSPLVFTLEAVNEIVCYYPHLPLEQANTFH